MTKHSPLPEDSIQKTKTKQPWSKKKKTIASLLAAVLVAAGVTGGVSISKHVAFTKAQDAYTAMQNDANKADKNNTKAFEGLNTTIETATELNKGAAAVIKDGKGYFGDKEFKALAKSQKAFAESLKLEVAEPVKTKDTSAKKELTKTVELEKATESLSKSVTPVTKQTAEYKRLEQSVLDAASAVTADLQKATTTVDKTSKAILKKNDKAIKATKDEFTKAAKAATDAGKSNDEKLTTTLSKYIEVGKKLNRSHKKVVADEKAKAEAAQAAAEAEAAQANWEAETYYEPDYSDYGSDYSSGESYSEPAPSSGGSSGGSSSGGGGGGFIDYGSGGSEIEAVPPNGSCTYNPSYGLSMGSGC